MPFEIYRPNPAQPQRKQGPAKITVTHYDNGRSQITVSAGTRDWLRPTPGAADARYPRNLPTMKLVLLVDRDARKLMLQRCEDGESGPHVHEVRGLGSDRSAYITGFRLEEELGLPAGHYLCELSSVDSEGIARRAATISLDSGVPAKTRATITDPMKRHIHEEQG
ncbi:hypothetical protein [Streptomyces brevispora]|uniref:hypothetical protein n=1 Tax=Streptomyces brevispora TaxID=887462 RepID=UPI00382F5167